MKNTAYLSLGTNLGDRLSNLHSALSAIEMEKGIKIEKVSSVYETDPVGYTNQAPFLNMTIRIQTSLSPEELLNRCLSIERKLGRIREFKWGPRIIDLDILVYNQDNIKSEKLIIPHPRMHERAFVLIPLLEIDPTFCFPGTRILLKERVKSIQGKEGVRLWKPINGDGAFELLEN
ncbi:2-amino-4-hydroxy-6-hydroxymethyldihydropteridine diphosphokinase [Bacillus xiapuensis]|uniref:2-amino-4-hydroxy-6- hydroxymethyldihydropteridine diphosphokinase n=1 Tax=Bacillus xiapuensis TaxID=2014075 RepID=UPI000C24C577|nr:2-amino-4-hydroxy-6-hydroxymethyldihydropteridine diphosphokinase [Bacillus xiapuensis]